MRTDEEIIQFIRERKFDSVHYFSIDRLTQSRIDAQAWAFLGQAMVGLKRGDMARKCFERVALLDPFANWVNQAWQDAAKVPNGMSDKKTLKLLEYEPVPVSACLLTRDSSRTIRQCIEPLSDAVDEIVVVDTGSIDDTVEIVESAGIHVHHFDWVDDFSAARNYAHSLARHDWVISVDSDEIVQNPQAIRASAGLFNGSGMALSVLIVNHVGASQEVSQVARIYQRASGVKWVYPIHENLMPAKGRLQTHPINIRLMHDGYDPNVTNQTEKINRNIRIIESVLKHDATNHVFLFYLARELHQIGQIDNALHNVALAAQYDDGESGFTEPIQNLLSQIKKRV